METLKTPLFARHQSLGAHMAEFGAFLMPIRYGRIIEEHLWVRSMVGLFDVSHMGQIFLSGPKAEAYLQHATINDVSRLKVGQGQYTALCREDGGIIDDLIVYRLKDSEYLLCVNAANITKDYDWLKGLDTKGVQLNNASADFGQLAIQGPKSLEALLRLAPEFNAIMKLAYCEILELPYHGVKTYLARTGYTGEKGYEWYLPNSVLVQAWDELLEKNPDLIKPIGLGARDTLRLEACYLLYGSDMDESTSPLQAGISWAVKLNKEDFVGKKALLAQKERGFSKQLYCFTMLDKSIARAHMSVHDNEGKVIGEVKSASVLPSLNKNGGILMAERLLSIGDEVFIDIRGQKQKAKIEKRPLYSAKTHD